MNKVRSDLDERKGRKEMESGDEEKDGGGRVREALFAVQRRVKTK